MGTSRGRSLSGIAHRLELALRSCCFAQMGRPGHDSENPMASERNKVNSRTALRASFG